MAESTSVCTIVYLDVLTNVYSSLPKKRGKNWFVAFDDFFFKDLSLLLNFTFYVYGCFACMSVCTPCNTHRGQRVCQILWNLQTVVSQPCGCWQIKPGSSEGIARKPLTSPVFAAFYSVNIPMVTSFRLAIQCLYTWSEKLWPWLGLLKQHELASACHWLTCPCYFKFWFWVVHLGVEFPGSSNVTGDS